MVQEFRAQGYSQTRNTFEDDVASIAMPFFSEPGDPTGSIAIALPAPEMTPERCQYLSNACSDLSWPLPDCLTPPIGTVTSGPP